MMMIHQKSAAALDHPSKRGKTGGEETMNNSIADMLNATLEEQAENDKIIRRRELKTGLFSFLLLFFTFSILCISAEFDAPGLLFLLVLVLAIFILVKVDYHGV